MEQRRSHRHLAFGVEPNRNKFRLRLSRYAALAETLAGFAAERGATADRPIDLLDAGSGNGRTYRYLEPTGLCPAVSFHALEYDAHRIEVMYARDRWAEVVQGDITQPLPWPDARFDFVVCEQVLEHLPGPDAIVRELTRVLRPGGLLLIGVPSFPPGLAGLRRHVVPAVDGLFGRERGHAQVFTARSATRLLADTPGLKVEQTRGFRIVSGGLLGPMEDHAWWYRLNRRAGDALPSLCTEVQVIARKVA